ncbi:excisionase family DNA-binding protein [Plantactinospora soyae]|uniref:Excisionase family DNA binding protein n=1 Tax=Plantactinospora soyae TaxID=1544732 RepID=A0A927R6R1_9ACTN|nr:excisionase family DNA-binding protein [Plantactinospora soyae]MBE1487141.1 excisionase family DNA binding protein [Plantactinospora soyae]
MSALTVNPVTPDPQSVAVAAAALTRVQAYLSSHEDSSATVRLVDDGESDQLVVPRGAVELLARVLAHMANGHGVSVVPAHAELTTQQAADLLNVSRPYLIGLLEAGEIEYRRVGTHRRVLAGSLLAYKHQDDARRRAAADELAGLAQDMDLS